MTWVVLIDEGGTGGGGRGVGLLLPDATGWIVIEEEAEGF
jgi:hypothetical protein